MDSICADGRPVKAYEPSSAVMIVFANPLEPVIATLAFGMTTPLSSVITPRRLAFWAWLDTANARRSFIELSTERISCGGHRSTLPFPTEESLKIWAVFGIAAKSEIQPHLLPYVKSSNSVTLSAFVHTPTFRHL